MKDYEQDSPRYIPTQRYEYADNSDAQPINRELGVAALTLREADGQTYEIDKRTIELTFAAGDSVMNEADNELREAKTTAGQNCLKAKSIGNKLRSRIDARASLVQGAAQTTERAVTSRLKTELGSISGRIEEVTETAAERIAELEAAAEEQIRLIREQLHRDTAAVSDQRDETLDQLHSHQNITENWAETNMSALTGNRDQALALFDERAAEIDRLVAHQVAVNEATMSDVDAIRQKLSLDRGELDRLRLRASELYDNYVQRMRDKLAIDERVMHSGKSLDQLRRDIHDTEVALSETVMHIGALELEFAAAVDYAKNQKYPGNPSLGAVLQHKDPHVSSLMTQKREAAHRVNQLNNRLVELEGVEQVRIQNRRPLLTEQGSALEAVRAAERSVQEAYRMMLRLQRSIADECSQLITATKAWMEKPVEIDVDTDDVTTANDDSVIALLTKGMTLDAELRATERPEEGHSESTDDAVRENVSVATDVTPVQQQSQNGIWNRNFGVPLVSRVVQATPAPGVIRTKDGTEVSFKCEAVS